mmetsp:Transcript_174370/g.553485  ORF Transcript_174370/g.553485 Transcript_174370/m.553485 type:complete len:326 (+) Transcript_174370:308-1285(+)
MQSLAFWFVCVCRCVSYSTRVGTHFVSPWPTLESSEPLFHKACTGLVRTSPLLGCQTLQLHLQWPFFRGLVYAPRACLGRPVQPAQWFLAKVREGGARRATTVRREATGTSLSLRGDVAFHTGEVGPLRMLLEDRVGTRGIVLVLVVVVVRQARQTTPRAKRARLLARDLPGAEGCQRAQGFLQGLGVFVKRPGPLKQGLGDDEESDLSGAHVRAEVGFIIIPRQQRVLAQHREGARLGAEAVPADHHVDAALKHQSATLRLVAIPVEPVFIVRHLHAQHGNPLHGLHLRGRYEPLHGFEPELQRGASGEGHAAQVRGDRADLVA